MHGKYGRTPLDTTELRSQESEAGIMKARGRRIASNEKVWSGRRISSEAEATHQRRQYYEQTGPTP